jgi:uncharacterized protein YndB with AHSA1/START domain
LQTEVSRAIAAPFGKVMEALTNPAHLVQWACAAAEVDVDRYVLRGATVPLGYLGGRLLERTPFVLEFEGPGESRVTVLLEPDTSDATRVTVTHAAIPAGALGAVLWEQDCWECAWSLWLRNLKGFAEYGRAPGLFDYAAPPSFPLRLQLAMPGAPERVWQAITDPEHRDQWLTVPLGAERRREEGRLVVYGAPFADMAENPEAEVVEWKLEPLPEGGTLVTLCHLGLPEPLWDLDLGWWDYLVALYQYTE